VAWGSGQAGRPCSRTIQEPLRSSVAKAAEAPSVGSPGCLVWEVLRTRPGRLGAERLGVVPGGDEQGGGDVVPDAEDGQ
jgi:hypothetical protein